MNVDHSRSTGANGRSLAGACSDETALELLFEHGYSIREVLRSLHSRVMRLPADDAPKVAHALDVACSALGRLCTKHPADARELGL